MKTYALALGLWVASGCGPVAIPTQIVLRVTSDMLQGPGQALQAVTVRVGSSSSAIDYVHTFHPGAGDAALPADLALSPPAGTTGGHVFVEVAAFGSDRATSVFYVDAEADYTPGHITLLEVALPHRCEDAFVNAGCQDEAGMTCGDPTCIPIAHSSLPVVDDIATADAGH